MDSAGAEGGLPGKSDACQRVEDVVEVPLLLTGSLAARLEVVAGERGLTAGQVIRHALRDFLARSAQPSPGDAGPGRS